MLRRHFGEPSRAAQYRLGSAPVSGSKGRLLIIDDDDKLVEAVELYLTRAGYDISTAADGLQEMQQMYSQRPDLIILDVMLPKMNGWETCQRIREISNVPIIMLTARGQEADKVMGLKLGACCPCRCGIASETG